MSGVARWGRASAKRGGAAPHDSRNPYVYDRIPKRDERFQDCRNQGVNAESFLYNSDCPPSRKR